MKVLVFLLSSIFSINSGFSQKLENPINSKSIRQIIHTLESGHKELITFQLSTILQIATNYGASSVESLKVPISTISVNSKDPELRYLAFLTLEALNSPTILENLPKYSIEKTEAVFGFIQNSLISYAYKNN